MKKLTQEVFDNAPGWVKSASIDADGSATYHDVPVEKLKPWINVPFPMMTGGSRDRDGGYGYDATDWQHSAIDRIEAVDVVRQLLTISAYQYSHSDCWVSNKAKEDRQKTKQEYDFDAICRIAEELDVAARALDKTANSRNENSIKEQLKQNNPAYFN